MTLSYNIYLLKPFHPSGQPLFSSRASSPPLQQREPLLMNASHPPIQYSHFQSLWTTSSGRTYAGGQTPFFTVHKGRWNTSRNKGKIKGCLPPLLLHHLLQARAPQCGGVFACLKVRVRIVGSSSGPCSCAGDPSWSGWAGWARWSGATPQREAPQCRRWTLAKTQQRLDYLPIFVTHGDALTGAICMHVWTHLSEWLG